MAKNFGILSLVTFVLVAQAWAVEAPRPVHAVGKAAVTKEIPGKVLCDQDLKKLMKEYRETMSPAERAEFFKDKLPEQSSLDPNAEVLLSRYLLTFDMPLNLNPLRQRDGEQLFAKVKHKRPKEFERYRDEVHLLAKHLVSVAGRARDASVSAATDELYNRARKAMETLAPNEKDLVNLREHLRAKLIRLKNFNSDCLN